jgi:hypothetical protein
MNTTISFIPNSDSDRSVWLNNFSTKINTYATLVGLTAAEVTAIQKDAAMYIYIINMLETYKQTVNNITLRCHPKPTNLGNRTGSSTRRCF